MNFDNFISVTCILCWHIGNFKFAFRYANTKCKVTLTCNMPNRLRPTCMTNTIGIMRREILQNIPEFCNQKIIQNHRKYEKYIQQKYAEVLCKKRQKLQTRTQEQQNRI
jgi:hypothetical protein